MATIKIYDASDPNNSIEIMNANECTDGQIQCAMDHSSAKNMLWFSINREDSIELIKYLMQQFEINRTEI